MAWTMSVTKCRKEVQADQKRTRRARLKRWRLGAPNLLSAHLFSGALCKGLWRSDHAGSAAAIELSRAPAGFGYYGGL